MKKIYAFAAAALVLAGVAIAIAYTGGASPQPGEKVYVALEGDGEVAVFDPERGTVIKRISLTDERTKTRYMPHNVQVSPRGDMVWVAANAMSADMDHQGFRFIETAYADEGHEDTETMSDQLIAIDPNTDAIVRRIPIGTDQHLAHVVQSNGGDVFVSAQERDRIYVMDPRSMTVTRSIALPQGSGPHGMRLSPDGKTLYAAFMGKALGIIDTASGDVSSVPLDGAAVQTAVAPDGSYAAVSVYDSRSVGIYDTSSRTLSYVKLPEGSQGPVQLYPSPDSKFLYVADQGVLNGRDANNAVYKIDVKTRAVVETIEAGKAPHGVALNSGGTRAYITNLKGDSISVIDTTAGREMREVRIGKAPNGVSVWNGGSGQNEGSLAGKQVTVYKSPTCGCCGNYIAELRRQKADVTVEEMPDAALSSKKAELGIPAPLHSCHTSVVDGYVVEGHVPIEAVVKLLSEKPATKGIALPGMPAGSPGMSGVKTEPFAVQTIEGSLFGSF